MNHGIAERRRQKAFRDSSPTVTPTGRAPSDPKGQRNGHLLSLGHEEENLIPSLREGVARDFFAARHIHWWRSARSGDEVTQNGPTRNMASSQIACVNFLLPLARNAPEALVALLRQIDDDMREVVTLQYIPRGTEMAVSSPVEFEWVGLESCLEGGPGTRGANTTSADALVVGVTDKDVRRAYLFEWKYVEEYKDAEFLGDGKSGDTRRGRYSDRYAAADSRFNRQVPLDDLFYEPFYQIMRLGLLGDKMVRDGEFNTSETRVVVVCPENNQAYRNTITSPALKDRFPTATAVEEVIKTSLRDPASFVITSPELLIGAVRQSSAKEAIAKWLAYQNERYGY